MQGQGLSSRQGLKIRCLYLLILCIFPKNLGLNTNTVNLELLWPKEVWCPSLVSRFSLLVIEQAKCACAPEQNYQSTVHRVLASMDNFRLISILLDYDYLFIDV